MPISKKANTAAKKKQWHKVEDAVLDKGGSPGKAARIANAVVRDHPSRKKGK